MRRRALRVYFPLSVTSKQCSKLLATLARLLIRIAICAVVLFMVVTVLIMLNRRPT